ncbi:MAG TPA: MarR family transcriptional regulator [Steroidobacteraceae bacterium]|nr:MarR family transcriptional regulator [Steroidobacteraceae bacterium]
MNADTQIYEVETYQPASCVGQLIYRVRAAQMSALDQELAQDPDLAPLEISAAQYTIISVLAKRGVDSGAQLCKDLSYDAGAMTRMIDRLEAKGLVNRSRCPEDRRLVKLELTEEGLAALPKLRACSVRVLNRLLLGFSLAEARQLEGFMVRMLQNV